VRAGEADESCLVLADLVQRDVLEPCLRVPVDRLEVGLGVRSGRDETPEVGGLDALGRLLEMPRQQQLL
jgi:hypothetical protein